MNGQTERLNGVQNKANYLRAVDPLRSGLTRTKAKLLTKMRYSVMKNQCLENQELEDRVKSASSRALIIGTTFAVA
jgi:hypothetical protein